MAIVAPEFSVSESKVLAPESVSTPLPVVSTVSGPVPPKRAALIVASWFTWIWDAAPVESEIAVASGDGVARRAESHLITRKSDGGGNCNCAGCAAEFRAIVAVPSHVRVGRSRVPVFGSLVPIARTSSAYAVAVATDVNRAAVPPKVNHRLRRHRRDQRQKTHQQERQDATASPCRGEVGVVSTLPGVRSLRCKRRLDGSPSCSCGWGWGLAYGGSDNETTRLLDN